MIDPQLIIAGLRRTTAVALAEFDPSGCLVDANAGFIRLLPEAVANQGRPDIAPTFCHPGSPDWWKCPGRGGNRSTTAS